VLAASIIRAVMEAASTSETSVNFYQTAWYSKPGDNNLQLLWLLSSNMLADVQFYYLAM
jgi:hypothetical protein